jgi:hypothetical protein
MSDDGCKERTDEILVTRPMIEAAIKAWFYRNMQETEADLWTSIYVAMERARREECASEN